MVGRLPEAISGPGPVSLRRWVREDAEQLTRAVAENVDHLRPWMPWITHVEIHHDQANEASAGVPRTLGFELVRSVPDEVTAPGEIGTSCECGG